MSPEIIGLQQWFDSPPGRYLLAWEQARFDEAVVDVFGYHSLQLGLPCIEGLRTNRMPHQWLALGPESGVHWPATAPALRHGVDLHADSVALPFPNASLDLLVLPHTLELSPDPHATLREAERVLMPEGRLVISGLNPASLWGLRQRRARLYQRWGRSKLFLPDSCDAIGYWRLRDWLRLLSFEVESAEFGCYRPAVRTAHWLGRFRFMESLGDRWWPILGAAYFVVAIKRVQGMRLLGPVWKPVRQRAAAPVPVTNRAHPEALGVPRHHGDAKVTTSRKHP